MNIKSIIIGNKTTVLTESKKYYPKGTVFILDKNGAPVNFEVVEIYIKDNCENILYTLMDISYYNPVRDIDNPMAIIQEELKVATLDEKKEAMKQKGYL